MPVPCLDASKAGGYADTGAPPRHQQRMWPPLETANVALFARVSEQLHLLPSVLEAMVNLPDFEWRWLGWVARVCRIWRDAAKCERLWMHVCRVQARAATATVTEAKPLGDATGTDSAACSSYRALARERELWVRRVQRVIDRDAPLALSSRGIASHCSTHRLWFRSHSHRRPAQPTAVPGWSSSMDILVAPSGIGMLFLCPDGEKCGAIQKPSGRDHLTLCSFECNSSSASSDGIRTGDLPATLPGLGTGCNLLGPMTVIADNQGQFLRFYQDTGNGEASCLGQFYATEHGVELQCGGDDVVPTVGLLKGPIVVVAATPGRLGTRPLLSFQNGYHKVGGVECATTGWYRGVRLWSTSG